MRGRLYARLIAVLLAPAVFASGAAQAQMLVRCGFEVRASCCCPKDVPVDPGPTMAAAAAAALCCDELAAPNAPASAVQDRAAPSAPAPVLVAIPGASVTVAPPVVRDLHVPRLDPPPGPSLVLANCALLI